MGDADALNIEKLLNAGYFTTSRARSTDPSVRTLLPCHHAVCFAGAPLCMLTCRCISSTDL